jgi:hypothetical protein
MQTPGEKASFEREMALLDRQLWLLRQKLVDVANAAPVQAAEDLPIHPFFAKFLPEEATKKPSNVLDFSLEGDSPQKTLPSALNVLSPEAQSTKKSKAVAIITPLSAQIPSASDTDQKLRATSVTVEEDTAPMKRPRVETDVLWKKPDGVQEQSKDLYPYKSIWTLTSEEIQALSVRNKADHVREKQRRDPTLVIGGDDSAESAHQTTRHSRQRYSYKTKMEAVRLFDSLDGDMPLKEKIQAVSVGMNIKLVTVHSWLSQSSARENIAKTYTEAPNKYSKRVSRVPALLRILNEALPAQ